MSAVLPGCLRRYARSGLAVSGLGLALLGGGLQGADDAAAAGSDAAGSPDNPYRIIPTRNAFGIRPPAPPPPPPAPAPAPKAPSNLFLTGISDWQGVRTVYLQVNRQGATPEFLELEEGDEQDDLKILSIDAKAEVVRVVHQGEESTLNFKENGLKAATPAAPAKGAVRTVAGRATRQAPTPSAIPARAAGPTIIGRGGNLQAQPPAAVVAPTQIQQGFTPVNTFPGQSVPTAVRGGVPLPNLQNRVRNVPPPPPLPIDPGLLQVLPGN